MTDARLGSGSGTIWLDEVRCSGLETDISQCWNRGFGQHDCLHSEDAGVICQGITLLHTKFALPLGSFRR